jgi:hypothetical protein
MKLRTAALPSLGAAALAVALLAAPAGATDNGNGHGNGNGRDNGAEHGNGNGRDHDGDADASAATTYTEDNDTNDGGTPNNVADDGDNAHPSGRDRSVERGGSGNQGRSESDPDDDGRGPDRSNGGPDKPNGSGGVDAADQDGNNGCGNDDDFEDDNEGWCGHKPERQQPAKPEAQPVDHEVKPANESGEHHHGGSADTCERHDHDHGDTGSVAPAAVERPVDKPVASASTGTPIRGTSGSNGTTTTTVADDDDDDAETGTTDTDVAPASAEVGDEVEGEVLGLELERGEMASTAAPATAELASTSSPAATTTGIASVAAGALAFTGDHLMVIAIAALVALAIGAALVARSRNQLV